MFLHSATGYSGPGRVPLQDNPDLLDFKWWHLERFKVDVTVYSNLLIVSIFKALMVHTCVWWIKPSGVLRNRLLYNGTF